MVILQEGFDISTVLTIMASTQVRFHPPIVRCIKIVQLLLTSPVIRPRKYESHSSTAEIDRQDSEHGREYAGNQLYGVQIKRVDPVVGLSNATGGSSVMTDANSSTNTHLPLTWLPPVIPPAFHLQRLALLDHVFDKKYQPYNRVS